MEHKKLLRALVVSILALAGTTALLCLLVGPAPAHADSPRYVALDCTGVPAPCYTTIQDAIDAAEPGDEIRVEQARYTGVLVRNNAAQVVQVDKEVAIRGGYDHGFQISFPLTRPTVVDAEGQGRVIYVRQYVSATIEGLWITGGNAAHAIQSPHQGGGVYGYGVNLTMANNVISHNVATTSTGNHGSGGGLYLSGSVVISGNRLISNVASTSYGGHGGGMYVSDADGAQVISNVVLSNTGAITGGQGFAGGIYLTRSDGAIVDGNQIEYNSAQAKLAPFNGAYGGGIYCRFSDDTVFRNNVVRHNTANAQMSNGGGGGVEIGASDGVRVHSNIFGYNTAAMRASGWGGGLEASESHDLLIEGNWVLSNSAANGGGLYIFYDSSFTMTNNIVACNVSAHTGGGLGLTSYSGKAVTGTLLHNTFAANDQGSGEGRSAIRTNAISVSLALANNLIYSHTYGILVGYGSSAQLHKTLFYANGWDIGGVGDIHNTDPITGQDPLLRADYHLRAGSPAIDAGVETGVMTDIDGDARPEGLGYDIGADELVRYNVYLSLVMRNR